MRCGRSDDVAFKTARRPGNEDHHGLGGLESVEGGEGLTQGGACGLEGFLGENLPDPAAKACGTCHLGITSPSAD